MAGEATPLRSSQILASYFHGVDGLGELHTTVRIVKFIAKSFLGTTPNLALVYFFVRYSIPNLLRKIGRL